MSTNNYPYQDGFEQYLSIQGLAAITIDEYTATLIDMFEYLSNFNLGYQENHKVSQLLDRDVEQYMQMLVNNRSIQNLTYNKILSHINIYFKFLFTHGFTNNLPTLTLKGKPKPQKIKGLSTKWLSALPEILTDEKVNPYTKLVLLLISKGFSVKEFLKPGFYKLMNKINFSENEKQFLKSFDDFIKPIQLKQNSNDIFLKQRYSDNPILTLPGLHKYLNPSEKLLGIELNPSVLYQSYIINYMVQFGHNLPDDVLSQKLNLDPTSIIYYRKEAEKYM
ncbi:phage integrase N-terminal SAM-like domain-containing protein [Apilactobacillus xinyiensis]|uniref:phage integrase N-terminal SAM-like domain-containing protein n=1 Tax=Apilactobacillus xinyiensis TaxID=2841032 RepID=UPI00200F07C7|nr:phage integrase N-terminal SAM-like domain-containing protein [Apilactobacillus xinyiensis]MCL0330496.1 phage integrase N-terminal SAM-like domain-containing protein [Apilactobacillus xinyiensis]